MKLRIPLYPVVLLGTLALGACADLGPTGPTPAGPNLSSAKGPKVDVCHVAGNGSVQLISVGAPAVRAHVAHGDAVVGAPLSDGNGLVGADCGEISVSVDPTTTYDTPIFGVTSASNFAEDCPAGYVAVGVSGSAGSWVGGATHWQVSLICQQLLPDGTLGATVTTTPRGSGANATTNLVYNEVCEAGQVLVGASGSYSPFGISSLELQCASVLRLAAGTGGSDSTIGPLDGTGVGFATEFEAPCDPGYAVTGLIGRDGAILDAVGVRCTKVAAVPV